MLPDIETFNILIAKHAAAGSSSAVNKIFENLVNSGIAPNERTFHLIASLCYDKKDIDSLVRAGKNMVTHTGVPVSQRLHPHPDLA